MPALLTGDLTATVKQRILLPLVTAAANMSGTRVFDYVKAVFGHENAEQALQERKAEMAGPEMANGWHGDGFACRCLMRAYVFMRGQKGEEEKENAEELMSIIKAYFPSDVVKNELTVVEQEYAEGN